MEVTFSAEIGGAPLSIQSGKLARQASGSVLVQHGETIVLVTVVAAHEPSPGVDFLPLSVEYQEKVYAAGRIPGNYFRREIGRPSEKEILTCRIIDRPIRPLFPDHYNHEVQVIATVLSMDQENEPDTLAMTGASSALVISEIPFDGPVACVRVGRINGEFRINPVISQWEKSDINLIVAGSKTGVVMVEGGGDFVSESDMLDAIYFGHEQMQPLIDLQEKLKDALGREKHVFVPPEKDNALIEKVEELSEEGIRSALSVTEKIPRQAAFREAKNTVLENLGEEYAERKPEVMSAFSELKKKMSRDLILNESKRIDGRAFDEVRPISCEVGLLPRTHGSALFTRGETQVLAVLTIGSSQDEQRVETLSGEELRAFMLHYNFPPYSVGETKRFAGPSRRDIGHGGLSTRALEKVIPSSDKFDYTIRVVSEVLESNGSSSMGTVCAGALALMDGGVPISDTVAGIAMGLIKEGDKVVILTDILGDEDHTGDMDFKVAGTKDGITAVQMDIKIREISREIMEKALEQAKEGRRHILNKMLDTLREARGEISPYAPKVISMKINPDRIRDIIGPGGKIIRALQSETGTRIEVDDEGIVKISATTKEAGDAAIERIKEIAPEPEIGKIYKGTVVKTTDFGAFVQILPNLDGLVHISQLSHKRIRKVTDFVREGDTLEVKILEIGKDGKIRLSHKAVLDEKDGRQKNKSE